jgi:hypothetical protein
LGPPAGGGAASPAAPSAAAHAASGLLALQAVGEGTPRRLAMPAARRDEVAGARAESLLATLSTLQREMLTGRVDRTTLERLASLKGGEDGADPALREVVQGLALRAAVELARHGMSLATTSSRIPTTA